MSWFELFECCRNINYCIKQLSYHKIFCGKWKMWCTNEGVTVNSVRHYFNEWVFNWFASKFTILELEGHARRSLQYSELRIYNACCCCWMCVRHWFVSFIRYLRIGFHKHVTVLYVVIVVVAAVVVVDLCCLSMLLVLFLYNRNRRHRYGWNISTACIHKILECRSNVKHFLTTLVQYVRELLIQRWLCRYSWFT